jgi:hypothetical protein
MNVGGPVVAEVTMFLTGTNNMDDAYRVMKWDAIQQNMGNLTIRAPNGQLVPEKDLWFSAALEDGSENVLDVGESFSLSSAQTKRMVRLSKYAAGLDAEARGTLHRLDLDIVDRLRKIHDKELVEVGEWFKDLPRADAWSQFNKRYPGKERMKMFRVFTGEYREVEAETDKEAEKKIGAKDEDKIVVVKGGSVIRGTRQEKEE